MRNLLFIILGALSLFLAFYYHRQYANTKQELELANRRILDRDTQIIRLQKQTQGTAILPSATSTLGRLNAAEINRLKNKGLKNPEADLKQSLLASQSSVLTHKGALGGTMAIRDMQVLNDRYALAYFEDGHSGGYILLRYQVSATGQVTWKVLDNYLI